MRLLDAKFQLRRAQTDDQGEPAVQLGYTRRAITDVLDELVEGGVMAAPVRLGGPVTTGC
jgi:hypothetical protein